MKKKSRSQLILVGVVATLTFLMGVVLNVTPALAEAVRVSGADHLYADGADGSSVDILTVTGQKGDTVYINMKKGDQMLASHLAFTLDDKTAKADANNDMVGIVSMELNGQEFSYDDTYTVEVFENRAETGEARQYTVSTVFAKYGDKTPQPLVVRTIGANDSDRHFSAPDTVKGADGVTYKLSSQQTTNIDEKECYVYEASGDLQESIEAHVKYYDQDNANSKPIKTETITLAKNTSQDVNVQSIVSDEGGALYRALTLADKLTVSYPGTSEYSIMCKKLSNEWGSVGRFYRANIKYVDTEGKGLGLADTVIVNKKYSYTAPDRLYVDDHGTVKQYQIQDKSQAVLQLEPTSSSANEGDKDYEIVYKLIEDNAPRTWTVVLENGSVSPKDQKRTIRRIDYTGAPGETVTHPTEQKINVDGVDYVPAASAQQSYEHVFSAASMEVEQTIYYVPDGYVAPEAYEVKVNYVNIATNEVIDSQTYTASPSMRADLEIEGPSTFSHGGIEWVKLAGQEAPVRHGFYSPNRTYTIYYRDINDDLHATTVIRNTRVVYVNEQGETVTRPTTVVNNGTTTTNAGTTTTDGGVATTDEGTITTNEGAIAPGATEDAAAGAGTVDTGLQTGADILAVDGADGQQLVGQDGNDLATTRIEDEETPLAQLSNDKAAGKIDPKAIAIGGGIAAAAVAAALILFFVFKRRKKNAGESSDEDLTA